MVKLKTGKHEEKIEKVLGVLMTSDISVQKAIELVGTDTYGENEETEEGEDDQPIIEASQENVKAALETLLTKENGLLAHLYKKHAEYNANHFEGKLARPLLTIEKMSNRTLGDYQPGKNASGIENHIRFNRNYVALNPVAVVERTLMHEMIHQWQDEVVYVKRGESPKIVSIPSIAKEHLAAMAVSYETGFPVTFTEGAQRNRVKNWHNKDFKAMACYVGIPAKGDKCFMPPVVMPEAKSYNRKFACGCIASNGKLVTIWSTREVHAKCTVCDEMFVELKKSGKVIEVKQSHVERPGEDAVRKLMEEQGYTSFRRFKTKHEKDDFMQELEDGEAAEGDVADVQDGFYQKDHNAYKEGYCYWVAYVTESNPDDVHPTDTDADAEEPESAPQEPESAPQEPESAPQEPEEREYNADSAQDILDLYKELGTTRKVAEHLGIGQSTLSGKAKKLGVNFKEGRIDG